MFDAREVRRALWLALPCLLLITANVHAEAPEVPEVLAVCSSCHGETGQKISHPDAPVIAGIPAPHFEEAVFSYQDGARECTIEPAMCAAVSQLTDDQVTELAGYFSAIVRTYSGEPYDSGLAETGEVIHTDRCSRCHVPPDDEGANDSLGIPLHGQRGAYLRYALNAYVTGTRETLAPRMARALEGVDANDIETLVHYYASYRSPGKD